MDTPLLKRYSKSKLRRMHSAKFSPAAFLDRDGVINFDKGYLHDWAEFEFLPGAIDAMRILQEPGCKLVVITSQSGITREMYSEEEYSTIIQSMKAALPEQGIKLRDVYHFSHYPDDLVPVLSIKCECRKLGIGMIRIAARDLNIDKSASVPIGDKVSDIQAGIAAGVGRCFSVRCDGVGDRPAPGRNCRHFDDLAQCVEYFY